MKQDWGRGWFLIWRQIDKHWTWKIKPFSIGQAWVDLLKRARYEDGIESSYGEKIVLKRGQVLCSIKSLAEDWGWSRGKVRRFLKRLCSSPGHPKNNSNYLKLRQLPNAEPISINGSKNEPEMIQQTDTQRTILTILNYDSYQNPFVNNGHLNGHLTDTRRTRRKKYKEEKELKDGEQEKISPPIDVEKCKENVSQFLDKYSKPEKQDEIEFIKPLSDLYKKCFPECRKVNWGVFVKIYRGEPPYRYFEAEQIRGAIKGTFEDNKFKKLDDTWARFLDRLMYPTKYAP